MLITLKNNCLRVTVNTLGAQMVSLRGADGLEYLWQGDPAYWEDRAPTLFPFIGRLSGGTYLYRGKRYRMGIHGFAAQQEFAPVEHTADTLVLELRSTLVTLAQYPFDFRFQVIFQLQENTLAVTYQVTNLSDHAMPFGVGGHPGFNVPLQPEEQFEDYVLEFTQPCQPEQIGFSKTVHMNGKDTPFPLEEGRCLPLRHGLFDQDAIILKNMDRQVTLRSVHTGRGVRITYPDMPYVGFWHMPKTEAPYVCIEPWSSLPGRQAVEEELSCRSDLIQLRAKRTYENTWYITAL